MKEVRLMLVLLGICTLVGANLRAEIFPPPGLYDPVTLLSTTTGDPYPTFPPDANRIPPLNLDRVDEADQALTILIQANDVSYTYEADNFDSLLYSVGIYPTGSMNDYFLESSYGAFGVEGEVVGWFTAEHEYSYYTWNAYGFGSYPHNAQMLAEEAVLAADAAGVDFSNYDNDGNGWVDALIIVHQGPGAEFTGSNDDIWSHRWALDDPIMLDGVWVYDYSMDPELEGDGSSGDIEPIAVFAHEYTHLLGLPDLYDYDEKLNPATFTVLGDENDHPVMDWGIMGYGGYGLSSYGKGTTPPHHTGYFKILLGWAEPTVLGLSQTGIQVPEVEMNPVIYQIPISGSDTEYFLVENRNSACATALFDHWDSDFSAWFNWFTPGSNPLDAGLIIYHIDEEMPLNDGWPDYDHYGCRVIDAGYTAAQPWPNLEFTEWWYPYEFRIGAAWCAEDDQSEFTPLTDPNTDGYYGPSGIYITNFSNSGSVMTFDLAFTVGSPEFGFAGIQVLNDGGDEDGFLDANETGDLYILVKNSGSREALQVSGTLSSTDPYLQILEGQADFPDIGVALSAQNITPFRISADESCPIGYDAEATLELTWQGGGSDTITVPLELNWDVMFSDDIESGVGSWTHEVAWGSYSDQWHRSSQRNHTSGGEYSWKCGQNGVGSYSPLLNAALVSQMFLFPAETRLRFWHRMNCEEEWDGGIAEIGSGTSWTQLDPVGGYPNAITHTGSGGPFSYGTPCYSSDFDWSSARVDIWGYSGPVQVRFRFGSDQGVGEEGWYIDDVCFYAPEGTVGLTGGKSQPVPGRFVLHPPHPNPFNASTIISFSLPARSPVRLEIFDVRGSRVATLVNGVKSAGEHSVSLSAASLASGVYVAVLTAPEGSLAAKILHVK